MEMIVGHVLSGWLGRREAGMDRMRCEGDVETVAARRWSLLWRVALLVRDRRRERAADRARAESAAVAGSSSSSARPKNAVSRRPRGTDAAAAAPSTASLEGVRLSRLDCSEASSPTVVVVADVTADAAAKSSGLRSESGGCWCAPPALSLHACDVARRMRIPRWRSLSRLALRLRANLLASAPSSSELVMPSLSSS